MWHLLSQSDHVVWALTVNHQQSYTACDYQELHHEVYRVELLALVCQLILEGSFRLNQVFVLLIDVKNILIVLFFCEAPTEIVKCI